MGNLFSVSKKRRASEAFQEEAKEAKRRHQEEEDESSSSSSRSCDSSNVDEAGSTCSQDESNSQDDDDVPIQQTTLTINDYTIRVKLYRGLYDSVKSIEASMTHHTREIGQMSGSIISRPTKIHNFYKVGDSVTQELHELTHTFCNSHGVIDKISCNLDEDGIHSGGFFHIEKVEVDVQYKGRDLGLLFLQHVLEYLKDMWVIAVMRPVPVTASFSERMNIDLDSVYRGDTVLSESEEARVNKLLEEAKDKICRYWARLGFQQAGRNREQCESWYLTETTFWNDIVDPSSGKATWKSKDDVNNLYFYKPSPTHVPQGVHKELADLIANKESMDKVTLFNQIKNLINHRNASLHESRVLFFLAANEEYTTEEQDIDTMRLLKELIHSTPSHVTKSDENGNTPLHVAAAALNLPVIDCLLEYGAKLDSKDSDDNTPLACLAKRLQGYQDFESTFCLGLPVKPSDILKKQRCILLLMEQEDKRPLIDGWMSPRMLFALSMSAALTFGALGELDYGYENRPIPLSTCCSFWDGIDHIKYIPPDVLSARNPNGLYQSFLTGWRMVWYSIASLLESGQVPTKSRVEAKIPHLFRENGGIFDSFDLHSWRHFLDKGGKIEYALDALVVQTSNVVLNGDDGWEYDSYEDDFEALSKTPLDGLFDLARVKILELNDQNVHLQPQGPYYSIFDNPYINADSK
ncbi:hypothetical protein CTEN210_12042 [Chaetoceros tenuissimus]|uniref:Uncharacterized protein n=1 Tax=Chaetoceros tenuissimus TaxID=426638 RepID=A0AAD3D2F8_9STRA|nr:hypothetical protein CTEN210_12042 [Chaetoceros tenuissimus]